MTPAPRNQAHLPFDLRQLAEQVASRRRALGWLAGAAGWALSGCGGGVDDTGADTDAGTAGTGSGTSTTGCSLIPEETAGPYPGDGSNTSSSGLANALALSGIVRSDIRASIAGASGVATGVPLTVRLRLLNTSSSCATLAGHAIYLWHCDSQGRYSMYSPGVTAENHLRGVQVTADDGFATFTTIFPGCYSGRVPHIHFEIYRNAGAATSFANKLRTSQLALPTAVSSAVYASATATDYGSSARNLSAISFASDNVFSDGVTTQLATVTGSVADGFLATLDIGLAA